MKPERLKILKPFVINLLRRGTFVWKPRTEAMKAARIERGLYLCAICKGSFKNKDIKLDHIDPVVDVKTGFVDFDTYIDRMFCEADNFQVCCRGCHDTKSSLEREMRKKYKKKDE